MGQDTILGIIIAVSGIAISIIIAVAAKHKANDNWNLACKRDIELAKVETQLGDLQDRIRVRRTENEKLQAENEKLKEQNDSIAQDNVRLRHINADLCKRVNTADNLIEDVTKDLSETKTTIKAVILTKEKLKAYLEEKK